VVGIRRAQRQNRHVDVYAMHDQALEAAGLRG
jgi:hypothetical protein